MLTRVESESGSTLEDAVDKMVFFSCLFSMNRKPRKQPRGWESDDGAGGWLLVPMAQHIDIGYKPQWLRQN